MAEIGPISTRFLQAAVPTPWTKSDMLTIRSSAMKIDIPNEYLQGVRKAETEILGAGCKIRSTSARGVPAITHLPSHDWVGPGYSAMETWHSPWVMCPSLLVVMIQDPLPSAHSVSLRAVFSK